MSCDWHHDKDRLLTTHSVFTRNNASNLYKIFNTKFINNSYQQKK